MTLMTPDLERRLNAIPATSTHDKGLDAKVQAIYYTLDGTGVWIITEGQKMANGNWYLWGFCHICCFEWGPITLWELEEIADYGIRIGMNEHPNGTVRDFIPPEEDYTKW